MTPDILRQLDGIRLTEGEWFELGRRIALVEHDDLELSELLALVDAIRAAQEELG